MPASGRFSERKAGVYGTLKPSTANGCRPAGNMVRRKYSSTAALTESPTVEATATFAKESPVKTEKPIDSHRTDEISTAVKSMAARYDGYYDVGK